jgi:hypothetical protein
MHTIVFGTGGCATGAAIKKPKKPGKQELYNRTVGGRNRDELNTLLILSKNAVAGSYRRADPPIRPQREKWCDIERTSRVV